MCYYKDGTLNLICWNVRLVPECNLQGEFVRPECINSFGTNPKYRISPLNFLEILTPLIICAIVLNDLESAKKQFICKQLACILIEGSQRL